MAEEKCSKCQALTSEFILSPTYKGKGFNHHDTFAALEASAAKGCMLCRLLRQYLIHATTQLKELYEKPGPIRVQRADHVYKAVAVCLGEIDTPICDRISSQDNLDGKAVSAIAAIVRMCLQLPVVLC
jgi:hypothetical protein